MSPACALFARAAAPGRTRPVLIEAVGRAVPKEQMPEPGSMHGAPPWQGADRAGLRRPGLSRIPAPFLASSAPLAAHAPSRTGTPSLPASLRRPSAPDCSPLAENRKKTAATRQPIADAPWRTNGTPESDFGHSSPLFLERPPCFFDSSWLTMVRESTANAPETFARDSRPIFLDRERTTWSPSRAANDGECLADDSPRSAIDSPPRSHDSRSAIAGPGSLASHRNWLAHDSEWLAHDSQLSLHQSRRAAQLPSSRIHRGFSNGTHRRRTRRASSRARPARRFIASASRWTFR